MQRSARRESPPDITTRPDSSISGRRLTPPSSLVQAHPPLPLGSLLLRLLASFGESLQVVTVVTSPCCPRQLPDVISNSLFLDAGSPTRRYTVCSHLFLPRCHRPSPKEKWVGFPQLSRLKRLRAGGLSRLQIFRYVPASKFARPPDRPYRCEYSAGQPGLLRPSRTRFVTSPRIGYANRPTTGNWRYGDLHPARPRPCRLLLSSIPPII